MAALLEQLAPVLADYHKYTEDLQAKLLAWADPDGAMVASPTRGMTSLLSMMVGITVSPTVATFATHVTREKVDPWLSRAALVCVGGQTWPLSDLPSALAIVIGYLAFVILGSAFMSVLPPVRFFGLRFLYNIVQVALCSYMAIEAALLAYRNGYSILPCEPYNAVDPPIGKLLWLFYVSKVFDFFDTFFIIMGKKWNQLSFLHVYHHVTIFSVYWLNLNAGYDGDIYLTIILNGTIHTIMYTYYFVSLHTQDIWWKKYLTMCQLIQFVTMMSQAIYILAIDCKTFSPQITKMYLGYIFSLFVLFMEFFVRSYVVKGGKKGSKGKASQNGKKLD